MNDRFTYSTITSTQKKKSTAPTSAPNFFSTPPTAFPQYTSGWANLPTGILGGSGAPSQPAPAPPTNAPKVYYPVNPLGPYSGPLGTVPTPPAAPQPGTKKPKYGLLNDFFGPLRSWREQHGRN